MLNNILVGALVHIYKHDVFVYIIKIYIFLNILIKIYGREISLNIKKYVLYFQ